MVADVCPICALYIYSHVAFHRKLFGDSSDTPAQPSKRLVLTKKTTYRLMEKQRRQGEDADEQGDEVCTD